MVGGSKYMCKPPGKDTGRINRCALWALGIDSSATEVQAGLFTPSSVGQGPRLSGAAQAIPVQ